MLCSLSDSARHKLMIRTLLVSHHRWRHTPSTHLQKSDQWLVEIASSAEGVRGAIGFRQIPGSSVFTTGQPTQDAARMILSKIEEKCPSINKIVWVCLREEPLCLINGTSPFALSHVHRSMGSLS